MQKNVNLQLDEYYPCGMKTGNEDRRNVTKYELCVPFIIALVGAAWHRGRAIPLFARVE